ncbi:MAG: type IX secretion system membrane protein PorP/SprF [Crocinitomicaceae bacterium]
MKKLVLIIATIASTLGANAQQDAMFTHYSFNTLGVNPAYAGSRDALTVLGLHRSQWVSFPGAPITQTVTAHMPIVNDKMGVGLSLLHDKIGPTRNMGFFVDFAYRIRVGDKGKLAFGIKGGTSMLANELADLSTTDGGDNTFAQNIQSQFLPNFGAGVYYQLPRFYVGLSTPRLLENDYQSNTTAGSVASEARHYFLIAGGMIDLTKDAKVQLKPTTFVKLTAGAPIEVDLTALFYFNQKFWAGPMFRTGDAFGVLAGLNINPQFSLGYSFDWSYGLNTGKYNAGSHELMLRYDFVFRDKGKILSPRYF